MKSKFTLKLYGLFFLLIVPNVPDKNSPETLVNNRGENRRVENSGIFALGYDKAPHTLAVLDIPYIIGGHVVVQWKDVEPAQGVYDFSLITAKIDRLKAIGKLSTLQINGNRKPDYLFDEVPWIEPLFSPESYDIGSLMYWHPAYKEAYLRLIVKMGEYLSERGSDFIGVRMNYNAFGTEHMQIRDASYIDASKWNHPEGVVRGVDFSEKEADAYREMVHNAHVKEISPHTRVFIRNQIDTRKFPDFDKYFKEGALSLFHTSTEPEPRASWTEKQYENFYDYCRPGYTTAYAESWTSSIGRGGQMESMPQWQYWRLLIDLHCGVST
jgi:hypothetical protein